MRCVQKTSCVCYHPVETSCVLCLLSSPIICLSLLCPVSADNSKQLLKYFLLVNFALEVMVINDCLYLFLASTILSGRFWALKSSECQNVLGMFKYRKTNEGKTSSLSIKNPMSLGLFIAPKCVKSQNQLPFHTLKNPTSKKLVDKFCIKDPKNERKNGQ